LYIYFIGELTQENLSKLDSTSFAQATASMDGSGLDLLIIDAPAEDIKIQDLCSSSSEFMEVITEEEGKIDVLVDSEMKDENYVEGHLSLSMFFF